MLLIAVETAPFHFIERIAIRETWKKYVEVAGLLSDFQQAQ